MKQLLDEAVDEEKWPGQASQLWSCSSVSQRPDPMNQPQVPAQASIQGEQGQASPKQGGGVPQD